MEENKITDVEWTEADQTDINNESQVSLEEEIPPTLGINVGEEVKVHTKFG